MRYLDELLIVDTIKEVGKVSRKEALKNRKKEASHPYIFIYTFVVYVAERAFCALQSWFKFKF